MTKEIINNTKITGTLNVTGAVDLDSTLNVDGTVNIEGATTIDDDLTVTGSLQSPTIVTPTISGLLQVTQPTLGSVVQRLQSTATNDDPIEDVIQARVATTDATVTTLATITIPASTTVGLEARVVVRRTGGSAGTAEDGGFFIYATAVKNVAGTATFVNSQTAVVQQIDATYVAEFDVTGSTVRLRVTGVTNTDLTWHATIRTYAVSS